MSLKQAVDSILRQIENPDGTGIPVSFYDRAVYDEAESKATGRPIYHNKLFVRKHKDNLSVYDSFARDEDIKQFPRQYELYLKNKQIRSDGVPIGMLPMITPVQLATCEACRIYTIEQLSTASDAVIVDIGDKSLRDRAIAYLNGQSEKDAEIARLKDVIAKLEAKLNDNSVNSSGRGRRKPAIREANNTGGQLEQGSAASS